MKYTTILFLLMSSVFINAQAGFNRLYTLDAIGTSFDDIIVDNDTLVILGNTYNDSLYIWQLTMIKMDTFGNIIQRFDKIEPSNSFINTWGAELIKTSDGGYMTTFNAHSDNSIAYAKFTKNLELEFYKTFTDESDFIKRQKNVVEVNDGYYLICEDQLTNYQEKISIIKTDFSGNVLWHKKYGTDIECESMWDVAQNSNGDIMIAGVSTGICQGINPFWRKVWFLRVDQNSGDVVWERLYPKNDTLIAALACDIECLPDNSYLLSASSGFTLFSLGRKMGIQRIDAAGDLIWSKQFEPYTKNFSISSLGRDIQPIGNGKYVIVGEYPIAYDYEDTKHDANVTIAFDGYTGDSLWERVDTSIFEADTLHNPYWQRHMFNAATLSSGSIVMVGFVQVPGFRSFGWMMKMDANGCMAEDDCPNGNAWPQVLVSTDDPIQKNELLFDVFPNPATDVLNVSFEGTYDLFLFDLYGQLVTHQSNCINNVTMDISNVPAGGYFLQIVTADGRSVRKVVME